MKEIEQLILNVPMTADSRATSVEWSPKSPLSPLVVLTLEHASKGRNPPHQERLRLDLGKQIILDPAEESIPADAIKNLSRSITVLLRPLILKMMLNESESKDPLTGERID